VGVHVGTRRKRLSRLFSVGYEGRSIEELVDVLRSHGVELLVDVRLNAISRRPGFSKRALAAALGAVDIDYLHERSLGNPPENRQNFRAGQEFARQRYIRRMRREGRDALARLADEVRERPTALLCVEREDISCHRTCIAEHLVEHGAAEVLTI
jgi:uncharacterized protein (DUF488 family)